MTANFLISTVGTSTKTDMQRLDATAELSETLPKIRSAFRSEVVASVAAHSDRQAFLQTVPTAAVACGSGRIPTNGKGHG